jgi:predicted amidohydrolase
MIAAAVQTDPKLADTAHNLQQILAGLEAAQADLVVFPECALSGYGFASREAALDVAQPLPGPASDAVAEVCARTGRTAVVGLLERAGEALYNSAAVITPAGLAGVYRKVHLPYLGVDRFVDGGDLGFPVFDTPAGRLGVLICYDLSFPEAARSLKLDGAQVLCVATNWPLAAEVSCVHSPPVRAQENHLHLVVCDRVGEESGFRFRGQSRVLDCDGRTLAEAGIEPTTVRAELDPAASDANRIVHVAGGYELDRIAHRRPETYGRVVE